MPWSNIVFFLVCGAAISAISLIGAQRLQEARRRQKAGDERRLLLLERTAEEIGDVNHVFLKYATLVGESGLNPDRVSPKQQEELNQLTSDLVSAFSRVAKAESTLLLLGEKQLEAALKNYIVKITQFRKIFPPGKPIENAEQIARGKQEISTARNQFYDALSERYDRHLSH